MVQKFSSDPNYLASLTEAVMLDGAGGEVGILRRQVEIALRVCTAEGGGEFWIRIVSPEGLGDLVSTVAGYWQTKVTMPIIYASTALLLYKAGDFAAHHEAQTQAGLSRLF